MPNKLKLGLIAALASATVILSDIRFPADAHGSHHRPRIGASHKTPTGAPETWGTYCITELAPLFREAIQLAQANQSTPPAGSTPASAAPAGSRCDQPARRNGEYQADVPGARPEA